LLHDIEAKRAPRGLTDWPAVASRKDIVHKGQPGQRHEAAIHGVLDKLCIISTVKNTSSCTALPVSARGFLLTKATFARDVLQKYGGTFECTVKTYSVAALFSGATSSDRVYSATILHVFESLVDLALVGLQLHEDSCPFSILPWGLPKHDPLLLPLGSTGPVIIKDSQAFEAGADVLLLKLSPVEAETQHQLSHPIATGFVNRIVTDSCAWQPAMIQSSFSDSVSGGMILISPGPPPQIIGLVLNVQTEPLKDRVLPHVLYALSTHQLEPLCKLLLQLPSKNFAVSARYEAQRADAVFDQLAQMDKRWHSKVCGGVANMIWALEAKSEASTRCASLNGHIQSAL